MEGTGRVKRTEGDTPSPFILSFIGELFCPGGQAYCLQPCHGMGRALRSSQVCNGLQTTNEKGPRSLRDPLKSMVPRDRIELPTRGFSGYKLIALFRMVIVCCITFRL